MLPIYVHNLCTQGFLYHVCMRVNAGLHYIMCMLTGAYYLVTTRIQIDFNTKYINTTKTPIHNNIDTLPGYIIYNTANNSYTKS